MADVAALAARVKLLERQLADKDTLLETFATALPAAARTCTCHTLATPLEDEGILDKVFSYVGDADYIFVACVCRKWRG
jgi:F-box domain